MLENENMVETSSTPEQNISGTQTIGNNTTDPQVARTLQNASESKERTYTKAEVQDLMRKRVERSHNAFFKRYGVTDLKSLDGLFDKTKQFDEMNSAYSNIMLENAEIKQINAFLKNNVNPDKYDDIKAYFKGTGTEFNEDTLIQLLTSHPEWLKAEPRQVESTTTMRTLGVEANSQPRESAEEKMNRIFGLK